MNRNTGWTRRVRALALPAVWLLTMTLGLAGCRATRSARFEVPVVKLDYEKYTLPNGLEVILRRDTRLPLVAVNLWYHVGPANESRRILVQSRLQIACAAGTDGSLTSLIVNTFRQCAGSCP